MEDRTARLEATVEQLRQSVLSLERRLEAVEERRQAATGNAEGVAVPAADHAAGSPAPEGAPARDPYDPIVLLNLTGRLLLVLAGGFFLRAMTDSGVLTPPLGLAIGFLYGLVWLWPAQRVAARGDNTAAMFYALATAMVAFPLLVEATIRFKVLTPVTSMAGATVLTAAMLFVAWHRRLRVVAWMTLAGALGTSLFLMVRTGVIPPVAVYLIGVGLAALWMGHALGWSGLKWPAALAANVAVAGATLRVLAPHDPDPVAPAIALQLLLLGAYLLSIAVRTVVRRRDVSPFDVVQSMLVLVIGFGGALYLTRVTGVSPAMLGAVSLVLGAVCYGVSVVFLASLDTGRRNAYFYTSLGLVLVLVGLLLVIGAPWRGTVLAVLAVVGAVGWQRSGRAFMLLQATVYLTVAGLASGAFVYAARLVAAVPVTPWAWPTAPMLVVVVAGAVASFAAATPGRDSVESFASGLRCAIALLFLAALGGCVIGAVAPLVGVTTAEGAADRGVLATVTTAVLAVSIFTVAWVGRRPRFREWGWLVYPLLVGTGLKLVAQDFGASRPATLFIALALYGAALIVAPRLRRDGGKQKAQSAEAVPEAD